jgi:hypothetical protein
VDSKILHSFFVPFLHGHACSKRVHAYAQLLRFTGGENSGNAAREEENCIGPHVGHQACLFFGSLPKEVTMSVRRVGSSSGPYDPYDVVVLDAGYAGFMAALRMVRRKSRLLILSGLAIA